MKEEWTGNLVGRMHNEDITQEDLANELGVTKAYISMILNGTRNPANARQILENAFISVKKKRTNVG